MNVGNSELLRQCKEKVDSTLRGQWGQICGSCHYKVEPFKRLNNIYKNILLSCINYTLYGVSS